MQARTLLSTGAWFVSIAAHGASIFLLPAIPSIPSSHQPKSHVTFTVVASPSKPHSRPTEGSSEPSPNRKQNVDPAKRAHTSAPLSPVSHPAAATVPMDLTGVTLAASDGTSWSAELGNGDQRTEPLRVRATEPSRSAPREAQSLPRQRTNTPLVPLGDLSKKPVPPPLNDALRDNYPERARLQGLPGRAVIAARIDRDGAVKDLRILSESATGFGAACQKTLLKSRWSAPLDGAGQAVSTLIRYTCQFRVDS